MPPPREFLLAPLLFAPLYGVAQRVQQGLPKRFRIHHLCGGLAHEVERKPLNPGRAAAVIAVVDLLLGVLCGQQMLYDGLPRGRLQPVPPGIRADVRKLVLDPLVEFVSHRMAQQLLQRVDLQVHQRVELVQQANQVAGPRLRLALKDRLFQALEVSARAAILLVHDFQILI